MNWAINFYRNQLNDKEKKVYDSIYSGWFSLKEKIDVPASFNDDDLFKVVEALIKDHPYLFWIKSSCFMITKSLLKTSITSYYLFDYTDIDYWSRKINNWIKWIEQQIPVTMNKEGKMWLLFDYLARQVTYKEAGFEYSHTCIGAICDEHIAVCEGVAKSFKVLCDAFDIPCIVVFGNADFDGDGGSGHAWNLVEYEGKFRHIDVTSELRLAKIKGIASQEDYLKKDNEMKSYFWDVNSIPRCV